MATELKTNGGTEYSPSKTELQNGQTGSGNGETRQEKYTRKDNEEDEDGERVPLKLKIPLDGDVEKAEAPVANTDEDDQDTRDSVSLKSGKKAKKKKKMDNKKDKTSPLKGI